MSAKEFFERAPNSVRGPAAEVTASGGVPRAAAAAAATAAAAEAAAATNVRRSSGAVDPVRGTGCCPDHRAPDAQGTEVEEHPGEDGELGGGNARLGANGESALQSLGCHPGEPKG